MTEFVTVATFTLPSELAIVKARMEAEGIECHIRNELTVQVDNFLSNAVGGIKLQVHKDDAENAILILKEMGYWHEEEVKQPVVIEYLDRKTSKIPLIKNLSLELRITIVAVSVAMIICTIAYKATKQTLAEKLEQNGWVVDRLIHNGKKVNVHTVGIVLVNANNDREIIHFMKGNAAYFPGLNSRAISGRWLCTQTHVLIEELDSDSLRNSIYEGMYSPDFDSDNTLILRSNSTQIYLHRGAFPF